MTSIYGNWGNGTVSNVSLFNQLLPYINGFNFRMAWSDIQTGPTTFTWTYFDQQLNYALSNNKYVGFMLFTGTNAPISGTNNWLASYVTTFTNAQGTWPYYFDSDYSTYWYAMTDAVIAHLQTYTLSQRQRILFFMAAEGSTGDSGPYKGTIPLAYQIDDSPGGDWDQFKRNYWTYLYGQLASLLPTTQLLINQGNDGDNFTWALDNIPKVWMKAGNFTHTYSIPGELQYGARISSLRNSPVSDNRVRGEFEGTDSQSWWQLSTKQNFFALITSALHNNIDIFNIAPSTASSNGYISDPYAMQFFTKYAGMRNSTSEKTAFIALRDEVDVNDTTRFSTGTYGLTITQNVPTYNTKLSNINSNLCPGGIYNNCYSPGVVDDRITSLDLTLNGAGTNYQYFNPTRISNIQTAVPGASYSLILDDQQRDVYTNDYILNGVPDNYSRYITQYSPSTTSVGQWRVGATTQYFGRYARQFKITSNQGEMFFSIDSGLASPSTSTNNVSFTITYYDSGTGIWSLNCATCRGKVEIGVMQNTNTSTWKQVTFSNNSFLFGGNLPNSTDFSLKYLSGGNTTFALIEFVNNSK